MALKRVDLLCVCGTDVVSEPIIDNIRYANGVADIRPCANCGLRRTYPLPVVSDLETTAYEDMDDIRGRLARVGRFRKYARGILSIIERHVRRNRPRLLDVGCSIGAAVLEAKSRGWDARGIDISSNAVSLGRERFGLDLQIARIEDIENDGRSYDAILLSQVLEHLPRPHESVCRLLDLVAPDGVVAVESPNMDGLYAKILGKRWYGFQVGQHLWHFTPRTIGIVAGAAKARLLAVSARSSMDYGLPLALTNFPARIMNCGDNLLALFTKP